MAIQPNANTLVQITTIRDGEILTESLRATPMVGDFYWIQSSPFYAENLSLGDIVRCAEVGGKIEFRKVKTRSGSCTVRVRFIDDVTAGDENDKIVQALVSFGCHVDSMNPRFYSVNVPTTIRLEAITSFLKDCRLAFEVSNPCERTSQTSGLKGIIARRFKWRP